MLIIVTSKYLKIYNTDTLEKGPVLYLTLLDGFVRDVTASLNCPDSTDVRLFVCTYEGHIFTHLLPVSDPSCFNGDELILVENIYIPENDKPGNKPVSTVFYSS